MLLITLITLIMITLIPRVPKIHRAYLEIMAAANEEVALRKGEKAAVAGQLADRVLLIKVR